MNMIEEKAKTLVKNKGFTLIELIVVIVIIGILATIAIPHFSSFSNSAKQRADIATGKTIATATATLYTSDGIKALSVEELYNEGYLKAIPESQTAGGVFTITWSSENFTVTVGSGADAVEVYPDIGFED